jgi:signal transduction histidine kinase
MRLTLTQRLSLVFAALLLVSCAASAWLQLRANHMRELEVVQGLSRQLAATIARDSHLMDANGLRPDAARQLFSQLMVVNPSVEVYLLDDQGTIIGHAAPEGRLRRDHVDLAPLRRLLAGDRLPVLGDDPRSVDGRKVFSAAPLKVQGRDRGFIYVVLLGEDHDQLAEQDATSAALTTALWSLALVALLCLVAGLLAFAWITRPLRQLTETVRRFDMDGAPAALPDTAPEAPHEGHEIAVLDSAFRQMAERLGEQWRELTRQDQQRRELIANISHDLRTPLSSLHGYLETLQLKDATLTPAERQRYLGIALDQSRKVGALAQSLFELARLEYGFVKPELEPFALTDLLQDVLQKFELNAQSREVTLDAHFPANVPPVRADLGLIERVLTNLLDNALRHTPAGGRVDIHLQPQGLDVLITVADTGPGIALELREGLFQRPFTLGGARRDGGLGLRIVHSILQLHGSSIRLLDQPQGGTAFCFGLPQA